jgi:hypothetical protein
MLIKSAFSISVILFICAGANAQIISGRILSDTSNKPISATIITHSGHQTSSNNNGEFNIPVSGAGDTIKVFAVGYKTYLFPVRNVKQNPVIIRLSQVSLMLRDVVIRANRNHKKDSITLRKDYAQVFNYQPPRLTDAFVSPPSNVPFAFVSVDLITVFNMLNRKNDPTYRLKKELLKDEQGDYIATRYNRGLVTRITGLKGDSLSQFMDKYYPTIDWVKKASDYDMIQYIKTKLAEFRKGP